MEVEPSTWYSSRDTYPSIDPAHWRLTSQPSLCSNHDSTWAHNYLVITVLRKLVTLTWDGVANDVRIEYYYGDCDESYLP